MKILTEINTPLSVYVNEERSEDEFIKYLLGLISKDMAIPNTTDIMLSQYRSNTYLAKVLRYETNTEQDLTLYIDIPLETKVFSELLLGFTVGDLFFIAEELLPPSLKKVVLRKLFFVGTDKKTLEVTGVSPSLITAKANSFEYRETPSGEGYLYWYNQPPAQIGCLAFSKSNEIFMSGYVSLGLIESLPGYVVPKLYEWVENNRDNILALDETERLVLFPEAVGSYLQTRVSNFSLNKGADTLPIETVRTLSNYYAASEAVKAVKFKPDISGESVTYMSPTTRPREENILLEKGGRKITRLEKSRGINILIKAV